MRRYLLKVSMMPYIAGQHISILVLVLNYTNTLSSSVESAHSPQLLADVISNKIPFVGLFNDCILGSKTICYMAPIKDLL